MFLHELGHFIALKYYKVNYSVILPSLRNGLVVGFKSEDLRGVENVKKALKISLAGGFSPLILTIPPYILGAKLIFFLTCELCLLYLAWTCYETWLNINNLHTEGAEIHG